MIVEASVPGREIECGVLAARGGGLPEASLPAEIRLRPGADWYDFSAKYLDDAVDFDVPADLTPEQTAAVQAAARRAYLAMDCAGLARVDFFLGTGPDGRDRLVINEVNTMPGFTPDLDVPADVGRHRRELPRAGRPAGAACRAGRRLPDRSVSPGGLAGGVSSCSLVLPASALGRVHRAVDGARRRAAGGAPRRRRGPRRADRHRGALRAAPAARRGAGSARGRQDRGRRRAYAEDPAREREVLEDYGYRHGWERFWGAGAGPVTSVFVDQFEHRAGAGAYAEDLARNDAEHYGGVLREDPPDLPGGCRLLTVDEPDPDPGWTGRRPSPGAPTACSAWG